ncbi:hypothetical protein Ciccas_007967 [Cichlidogyrus casuarinus]|uniref:Uncharacterized protein n=1 Tax=Cichlidogyrus casuarinus TaxID=1844966 RepID=A0ABD2Q1M1_9PLAT
MIGIRPDIYYSMTHFLRLCPNTENTLNLISKCSKSQEDIETALSAILKRYKVGQEAKQENHYLQLESRVKTSLSKHVCDPLELIIGSEVFVKDQGQSDRYLLGIVVTKNSSSTFIVSFDQFNKYSKAFVEVQKQIKYSELISAMELRRHEIRQLDFVLCQVLDEKSKIMLNEYKIGRFPDPNDSDGYESLLINFGESVVRRSVLSCFWIPQEMVSPEIYIRLGQGNSELKTKDKKLCYEFDRVNATPRNSQQRIPFTYTLHDLNSERFHFSVPPEKRNEVVEVNTTLPRSKTDSSLAATYRDLRDNWTETDARDFLHSLDCYNNKSRNRTRNFIAPEVKPPWRYWGSKPIPNAISEEVIFDVFRDSLDFKSYDIPREESILINGEGMSFI